MTKNLLNHALHIFIIAMFHNLIMKHSFI